MKHETFSCDIKDCGETVVSARKVPVMFDHDQDDGKSKTDPYFEIKELDLCEHHWKQMTGTRTLSHGRDVLCNILHEFLQDCLDDPMENEPLARRGRKEMYAQRIFDFVDKLYG